MRREASASVVFAGQRNARGFRWERQRLRRRPDSAGYLQLLSGQGLHVDGLQRG